MSAWGDTLTEQLAHDILMDQQQTSTWTLDGADAIGDDDVAVGRTGTAHTSARFRTMVTPGGA